MAKEIRVMQEYSIENTICHAQFYNEKTNEVVGCQFCDGYEEGAIRELRRVFKEKNMKKRHIKTEHYFPITDGTDGRFVDL